MKQQLLMTVDNPEGWKLEELLEKIAKEIRVKTERLKDCDETPTVITIKENNDEIAKKLDECIILQMGTMEALDEVGPNQGPLGNPRI